MIRKTTLAALLAASVPLAIASISAEAAPMLDTTNSEAAPNLDNTAPGTDNPDVFVGVLGTLWSMSQSGPGQPGDQGPITDLPDTTQVPEPGTLALLGAGLVGLAMLRRRKTA